MKYSSFMIEDILNQTSNKLNFLLKSDDDILLDKIFDENKILNDYKCIECNSTITPLNKIKFNNQEKLNLNIKTDSENKYIIENIKNNQFIHSCLNLDKSIQINEIQKNPLFRLNLEKSTNEKLSKNLSLSILSPSISTFSSLSSSSSTQKSFKYFNQLNEFSPLNQFNKNENFPNLFQYLSSTATCSKRTNIDFYSISNYQQYLNNKLNKLNENYNQDVFNSKITLKNKSLSNVDEYLEKVTDSLNDKNLANYFRQTNTQYYMQQLYIKMKMLMQAKPRKGGQIRFNNQQTNELENMFNNKKYLIPLERKQIAKKLTLSERQVKTWFQNRRAKWRKVKNY